LVSNISNKVKDQKGTPTTSRRNNKS